MLKDVQNFILIDKYIIKCILKQMLLEIKLRSFTRKYKLITNVIFLAAIMSSGYLLYNIPFNSAYALCKGLVSTSLTIGFVPTGPKPDQPSGYMITGY